MKAIRHHLLRKHITYTGEQLRSHWIMRQTNIVGDAIVAFQGPADVPIDNMVDLVDVKNDAPIASRLMLHFIVEHFGVSLQESVVRQRLLMAIIGEELNALKKAEKIVRRGDDLFDGQRKLSVSIAAASTVSCCIHVGLNVDSKGTPVPAVGLADYGIRAGRFAQAIMKRYAEECHQIALACCKVRPIP